MEFKGEEVAFIWLYNHRIIYNINIKLCKLKLNYAIKCPVKYIPIFS